MVAHRRDKCLSIVEIDLVQVRRASRGGVSADLASIIPPCQVRDGVERRARGQRADHLQQRALGRVAAQDEVDLREVADEFEMVVS